jgi:5-deoxy-glucuronate isomerase
MKYHFPADSFTGYRQIVKIGETTPFTGFGLAKLGAGESVGWTNDAAETVAVILSGQVTIEVGPQRYEKLGNRKDVFSGRATSVYIPLGTAYKVTEVQGATAEVALVTAATDKQYEPFVIKPEDVIVNHRGALNWQRDVHDIVTDKWDGWVDRIVVGETFSYPGQWSSYPSHKHDTFNPPLESKMDEIYYFKIKPTEGFGVQVMYTDDLSMREAYMLKDGDVVALPEGYHPVACAPGHQLYYLWVMAGEYGRKLIPHDDPNLAWLQNVGPLLK